MSDWFIHYHLDAAYHIVWDVLTNKMSALAKNIKQIVEEDKQV